MNSGGIYLILLGKPGAGKGTQAKFLSKFLNIPTISTGDIVRGELRKNSELGKKFKQYNDSGDLVPDNLIVDMVLSRISESDCTKGYILDGFPRTLAQAVAFDKILEEKNLKLSQVLTFNAENEEVIKRISGRRMCKGCGNSSHIEFNPTKVKGICDDCQSETYQRADDAPDVVLARLKTYEEETKPLIHFYEEKALNTVFNANLEPQEIEENLKSYFQDHLA